MKTYKKMNIKRIIAKILIIAVLLSCNGINVFADSIDNENETNIKEVENKKNTYYDYEKNEEFLYVENNELEKQNEELTKENKYKENIENINDENLEENIKYKQISENETEYNEEIEEEIYYEYEEENDEEEVLNNEKNESENKKSEENEINENLNKLECEEEILEDEKSEVKNEEEQIYENEFENCEEEKEDEEYIESTKNNENEKSEEKNINEEEINEEEINDEKIIEEKNKEEKEEDNLEKTENESLINEKDEINKKEILIESNEEENYYNSENEKEYIEGSQKETFIKEEKENSENDETHDIYEKEEKKENKLEEENKNEIKENYNNDNFIEMIDEENDKEEIKINIENEKSIESIDSIDSIEEDIISNTVNIENIESKEEIVNVEKSEIKNEINNQLSNKLNNKEINKKSTNSEISELEKLIKESTISNTIELSEKSTSSNTNLFGAATIYYKTETITSTNKTFVLTTINTGDLEVFTGGIPGDVLPNRIKKIRIDNEIHPTTCKNFFNGFKAVETIEGIDNLKTDLVDDMSNMFYLCQKLTAVDVSSFDTSNVKYFNGMFSACEELTTLNLSTFDTSKAIDMKEMFDGDKKLATININGFNTSHVKDMSRMFCNCQNLTNIDDVFLFNTGEVKNMSLMFYGCEKIEEFNFGSSFNTSLVSTMSNMFGNCDNITNIDLTQFNLDNVVDLSGIFESCDNLESVKISSLSNTINLKNISRMFYDCKKISDISLLKYLNTNNVIDISYLFYGCESLEDINFETDFINFNTDNVLNMAGLFGNCKNLVNLNLNTFNTENVENMEGMFENAIKLKGSPYENFNTSSLINMGSMFAGTGFESIDLSNFNTSNVINMERLFTDDKGLKEIKGLEKFDTSKVKSMQMMFKNCVNIEVLDLHSFNTKKVTKIYEMFNMEQASKIRIIYATSYFDLTDTTERTFSNSSDYAYIFRGCTNLVGGKGTIFDSTHDDRTYARVDEGATNKGYFSGPIYKNVRSGVEYYKLVEVIENISNGDTIKVLNDITVDTKENMDFTTKTAKSLTLDFNNYKMYLLNNVEGKEFFNIIGANDVKITNADIYAKEATNSCLIFNTDDVTNLRFNNVKLNDNNNVTFLKLTNNSSVTFSSCQININREANFIDATENGNDGNIKISSGTYKAKQSLIKASGNLMLTGGTYESEKSLIENKGSITTVGLSNITFNKAKNIAYTDNGILMCVINSGEYNVTECLLDIESGANTTGLTINDGKFKYNTVVIDNAHETNVMKICGGKYKDNTTDSIEVKKAKFDNLLEVGKQVGELVGDPTYEFNIKIGNYKISYDLGDVGATFKSGVVNPDNRDYLVEKILYTVDKINIPQGHIFNGWYDIADESKTILTKIEGTVTRDIELKASWQKEQYKVIFDTTGSAVTIATQNVLYGEYAIEPEDKPTKTGYDFNYWYVGEDETIKFNFESTVIKGNITLKPFYKEKKYKITYDLIYDDIRFKSNAANPVTRKYTEAKDLYTEVNMIIPEAYEFIGWYKDGDETETIITKIPKKTAEDVLLKAKWIVTSYDVEFNMMGFGEQVESQNVLKGYKITKIDKPNAINHRFEGWYKEETFDTLFDIDNDKVREEMTLYAKWVEATTYTVRFLNFDGSEYIKKYIEENTICEKPINDPEKPGYTFKYWYEDDEDVSFDFAKRILKDTTLKARFSDESYTVTYELNNDKAVFRDGQSSVVTRLYSDALTLYEVGSLKVPEGNIFIGWYKKNDATQTIITTIPAKTKENVIVVAKWEIKQYDVRFNMMGHGEQIDIQKVSYGSKVIKPENPDSEDFAFSGWYRDQKCQVEFNFDEYIVKTNIDIYAKWYRKSKEYEKVKYTITFNANGGTGTMPSLTDEEGKIITLPKNEFTMKDYSFSHWVDEYNYNYMDKQEVLLINSFTLKAVWKKNEVKKQSSSSGGGGGGGSSQGSGGNTGIGPGMTGDITDPLNTNVIPVGLEQGITNLQTSKVAETTNNTNEPIYKLENCNWIKDAFGNWQMEYRNPDNTVKKCAGELVSVENVENGQKVVNQYLFKEDGNMFISWYVVSDEIKFYFCADNDQNLGKMWKGWKNINGNYYYFGDNGLLLMNTTTPDGYIVDMNGIWVQQNANVN